MSKIFSSEFLAKKPFLKKIHVFLRNLAIFALTVAVIWCAVWGPEALTEYRDKALLYQVTVEPMEPEEGAGYRYSLSSNEKLYVLSRCLNNQILPESVQNAMTRPEGETDYQELNGAYAFVVNQRELSQREITKAQIWDSCSESMELLYELGILPGKVKKVQAASYDAVLYSAIDVLEPRNNLAVWKISLSTGKRNADKAGRLIDAYMDADTGKVYEFYVRTDATWDQIDADAVIEKWSEYMGLTGGEAFEDTNPMLETTPYYRKYSFPRDGEDDTVVTVGFYEGINEFFLKIAR